MITDSKTLPTVFAKTIAESVGLLEKLETGLNHVKYNNKMQRLIAFQQMAVTCTLKDAMIAFHGEEISEDQMQALDVIYRSTKPWMLGHVVGVLLTKLDDKKMTNRDFAESVRTIVDQLTKDGHGEVASGIKGMLVRLTG